MCENKKKEPGFSLAEALITLLIVCLITIASIPVLTKKHRSKLAKKESISYSHGQYLCYMDSSGNHKYKQKIDDVEKSGDGENGYCEFEPPANAKDFLIMASGGGAGGGAGYSYKDNEVFMSSGTYKIPQTGSYDLLVIGGGGAGSAKDDDGEFSGGSGGWDLKTVNFNKGDNLIIQIGKGAQLSAENDDGKNEKEPSQGGTTSILSNSLQIMATGGYSNPGEEMLCFGAYIGLDACPGEPNGKEGGFLEGVIVPDIPKGYLPENILPVPGSSTGIYSVYWNNNMAAKILNGNGADGAAVVAANQNLCGEGGGAGIFSTVGFYSLSKDKIQIRLGKGGKGALDSTHPASDGEMTSVGNLVKVLGGKAGSSITECTSSADGKMYFGKPGEASIWVKSSDSVGACGGSTSCKTADISGESLNYTADVNGMTAKSYGSGGGGGATGGRGGDGAPGFVYIKW